MARFRLPMPLFILLLVVQLTSFLIISYLARENVTLKKAIVSISLGCKHQLRTRKIRESTLNETMKPTNIPTILSPPKATNPPTTKSQQGRIKNVNLNSNPELIKTTENMNLKEANNNIPNKSRLKRNTNTATGSSIKKRSRKFTPSLLTIVILKTSSDDSEDFYKTQESIRRLYPSAQELILSTNNNDEPLISKVKTEYFLVLEEGVMLSNRFNESIDMLWDALELFPEIDFIGGSYLADEKLHVGCHKYRLCKWTFTASYEYKRSLGNVMICDGTSSTFMGRRESMEKVKGGLDFGIHNTLMVTDFFLRAKQSQNVVVGTLPNVMFLKEHFANLYESWQTRNIAKEILPFAVKHKVFIFKDWEGNTIDVCSRTSPISGKYICNENIAHNKMLGGDHWAYKGIFTYPYVMKNLGITLSEVTKFFEENNVNYVIIGGTSLGAIKTHSILPWEAGDIDIHVYGTSAVQLRNMMDPWADKNDYIIKTYKNEVVHIFCTSKEIGEVSGGLATINTYRWKTPPEFVKIKTNGIWVRYFRDFYHFFLEHYGEKYLEHKIYNSQEIISCKLHGHNACLPNFKSLYQGKAGTLKDFYCRTGEFC